MKKILQINTTLNWGSTGRIAEQIAILAESRGWKCYIAHGGRYINESRIDSIQISSKFDNYFHAFIGRFFGLHGFGSILSTYLFIKKIKELNPDIIHLHNLHGYYINFPMLFRYLVKHEIPVVWTLHDCWSITGHCTHFENIGCSKWKTQCNHCPQLFSQYKSICDRSSQNFKIKNNLYHKLNSLTIVPVSEWLANLVSDSILKNHHLKVIRNGVDLKIFKPVKNNLRSKLNISNQKYVILGVVSSGFKGKEEFISLSKNEKFQVVIVGIKKEWMEGLPSNIICISRTNSQEELAKFYSLADVFVNPTYDDTFPTTNIEALACGTPVVTYNAGGSPEIISKETGMSVPRGEVKEMESAILNIVFQGKETYSYACRKRAEKYFDKNDRFVEYVNLYDTLV